jgi:hypothetical protein
MVRYVSRKGSQAREDAPRPVQLSKSQAQQNAVSRRDGARGLYEHTPSKGCRESRVPEHTRSLACEIKKHTSKYTTGLPETPGLPCAMVLTVSFVLSLVSRALLPPSSARCESIVANLTPASGRQDHTTSPSASAPLVLRRRRVHRIPHPTFVTIAIRPSIRGGTANR